MDTTGFYIVHFIPSFKKCPTYIRNSITYFIFMSIAGGITINEKRYRYHSALPVTARELAVADVLYVVLVQAGMSVLWIVYLFFRRESATSEALWAMTANNATIVSVITLLSIHYHLSFFETKKYKRLNWAFVLTFILFVIELGYFGKLGAVAKTVWRYYASGRGAFISFLICGWLLLLGGAVFERRRSYLG